MQIVSKSKNLCSFSFVYARPFIYVSPNSSFLGLLVNNISAMAVRPLAGAVTSRNFRDNLPTSTWSRPVPCWGHKVNRLLQDNSLTFHNYISQIRSTWVAKIVLITAQGKTHWKAWLTYSNTQSVPVACKTLTQCFLHGCTCNCAW